MHNPANFRAIPQVSCGSCQHRILFAPDNHLSSGGWACRKGSIPDGIMDNVIDDICNYVCDRFTHEDSVIDIDEYMQLED